MKAPAYRLEAVTFAYDDGAPVLDVPELSIPGGAITALTGPNGGGKTTLLHLLALVEAPSGGRLSWFGEDVTSDRVRSLRSRIGLLPQNPYLFDLTVVGNVEWGLKIRGAPRADARRRAAAALEEVRLGGLAQRQAAQLSGGEAKRLALARVLSLEPDVLLLDEPFAHMDRESAERAENLILQCSGERGVTVVLASHDALRAQAMARHAFCVRDGTVTPAVPTNVFRGRLSAGGLHFETGRISISVAPPPSEGTHVAIDPSAIVLSTESLRSSMRNTFRGRITAVSRQEGSVHVQVEAGERFSVLITRDSLGMLGLAEGTEVYLCFKATAARVF